MTENNEIVSRDEDSTERKLVRQREVNEALVLSSLHAQEETEAAEARAETLLATAELRERLLGILGHDLRSPLSAIMTVASALLSRGNAEELALGSSVSVQCSVEGDVTGSWDVDRLAEVISNVGRNAIEHARPGTSVALHVTARPPASSW